MALSSALLHFFGMPPLAKNSFAESQPRILFYCASNIGLGHLGRVLRVTKKLRAELPEGNILLATDARESALAAQTSSLAVMKLPAFEFVNEAYAEKPFALNINKRQLHVIRKNLLLSLIHSYRPHVVYMDTLPHGKQDEMMSALKWTRRHGGKVILCMRDIPAAPDEDFKFTDLQRVVEELSLYDRILIAGDQSFFDPAAAYKWPQSIREKTRHIGFVIPKCKTTPRTGDPSPAGREIVASFGGGWEAVECGRVVIESMKKIAQNGADLRLKLYTGPAISEDDFRELGQSVGNLGIVQRFSSDFARDLANAAVAILQAGSTVFQVLDSDMPLIVYFRDFKDKEQEIRANLLSKFPGISVLGKSQFSVENVAANLANALEKPRMARITGYSFDGVNAAVREIINTIPPIS